MASTNRVNRFINELNGLTGDVTLFDFAKKEYAARLHINYMLTRTQSMFKWENLPETIPERIPELYIQSAGHTAVYEHKDNLYMFVGAAGGVLDEYYFPTEYIINNPALNLYVNAKINKDCILIPNDSLYMGLLPLFEKYASAMVENELSLKIAMENTRVIDFISAQDDRTRASAEKFIEEVKAGRTAVVGESAFFDGIRVQPYGSTANTNMLTNLIELEQYLKASWFNELGLNANYNMKRESINAGESQLNNDALLPLVDNMLLCRQKAVEDINRKFGTNIKVSLSSSWEDNEEEIAIQQNELFQSTGNDKGETDENKQVE